MSEPVQPFRMIYGIGQGAPTVMHRAEDIAVREASRLARLHPGIQFVVLKATHTVLKRDVEIQHIDPDFAEVEPRRSPMDRRTPAGMEARARAAQALTDDIPF